MINKPQPEEYPEYAAPYVSLVLPDNVLDLLTDLQESSYIFFSNLSDQQAGYAYEENKWTVKQVLGHMIDTERVFGYRAFCFSRERTELPEFDQDVYVENAHFNTQTIQSLAEEFKAVRASNLYMFRDLKSDQYLNSGIVNNYKVSVRALIYMIAGHELYHLKLLKERYLL
ncbi:DinB family protein [Mucilaginibacter segetis]|uniref:DinB family protein n=1 Tax=Mucilaginibacter segetis TaxID=2793071 RepID=A0A934PWJ6_9SPHI|nr:DinB family protein [Mucilaginibacter segetis]MBK0380323.1 DinB family protein [Mucilaginibacter segetis]